MVDREMVAANLRVLRALKHVKQADVAAATETSQNTIGKYENAECGMSLEAAVRLADYYDVSVDEMVGRSLRITKIT